MKNEPTMEIILITPSMAMKWLEGNTKNRSISDATVEAYAADMKSGNWKFTHQGVAFTTEGVLADGQHRLWAIVKANVSVKMAVWRNLDPEALGNIDGGRLRSVSDQLGLLDDITDSTRVASDLVVLRAIEGMVIGEFSRLSEKTTLAQSREVLNRHEKAIMWLLSLPNQKGIRRLGSGIRGSFAYAYPSAPEKLTDFVTKVSTGEGLFAGDPALALRNFQMGFKAHGKADRNVLIFATLRSIHAAIYDHKLEVIKPTTLTTDSTGMQTVFKFFVKAHKVKP
jgi:hypothetical protein